MAKAPVLTPQADDFPRWYQDLINKAELADNGPVRGTMVIRPYGYSLWERMQQEMDARIKEAGAQNAYFPLFIPQSYLTREAEHVEGFAPELAVVTHGGGKELEEPVVVRPTSETIINEYFSKWVQSYRDLPLLINQWANVVRWEMRSRLFLRTSEFLWQEGHTAHATYEDAREYAAMIHRDVYGDFMTEVLGIDVVLGRKTARERFMRRHQHPHPRGHDGRRQGAAAGHQPRAGHQLREGLQHLLPLEGGAAGAGLADLLGCVDPHGRRPDHVPRRRQRTACAAAAGPGAGRRPGDQGRRRGRRQGPRDRRPAQGRGHSRPGRRAHRHPFGRRAVDWELKGVPVRVEVGPRDLENGTAMLARRIPGGKEPVAIDELAALLPKVLEEDQATLLRQSRERRESRTVDVKTIAEAAEAAATGWGRIPWADLGPEGEAKLAEQGVSVRCLLTEDGAVPEADDAPGTVALVARAY